MDDFPSFLRSVAAVLGAVAWPTSLVVIVLTLRQPLKSLLHALRDRVSDPSQVLQASALGLVGSIARQGPEGAATSGEPLPTLDDDRADTLVPAHDPNSGVTLTNEQFAQVQ